MKRQNFTIFLMLLTFFLLEITVSGQPADCVPNSGVTSTITFGQGIIPTLNGAPLPNGSYISAMFNTSSGLKCAGFVKWEDKPTSIGAQGKNGTFEGYADGEVYKYRIQLPNGMIIQNSNITVSYKPVDPIFCDNGSDYKKDGISCIQTFAAVQATSTENYKDESNTFIFPNPSSGSIVFKTDLILSGKVTITDVNGRQYYFQMKDNILDLSELNAGVYIIKYSKENFNFREKIILLD